MAGLNDLLNEGGSLKAPALSDAVGGSSNRDLMADARASLSGNWGLAVLGYILYFVLIMSFSLFLVSSVVFVNVVGSYSGIRPDAAIQAMQLFANLVEMLISGPIIVGFMGFFLGVARESEARLELLFVGFQRFWRSFGVYFLTSLFIFLWLLPYFAVVILSGIMQLTWPALVTMPLILLGIIAAFRYAMAFFIIADDEDCGALEAIRRSKEMMRGNKWKFFCLHWRFFGWALLATIVTFGIGWIWLVPYMQTTFAKFYEDVK